MVILSHHGHHTRSESCPYFSERRWRSIDRYDPAGHLRTGSSGRGDPGVRALGSIPAVTGLSLCGCAVAVAHIVAAYVPTPGGGVCWTIRDWCDEPCCHVRNTSRCHRKLRLCGSGFGDAGVVITFARLILPRLSLFSPRLPMRFHWLQKYYTRFMKVSQAR